MSTTWKQVGREAVRFILIWAVIVGAASVALVSLDKNVSLFLMLFAFIYSSLVIGIPVGIGVWALYRMIKFAL